jgi:ribonuclease J
LLIVAATIDSDTGTIIAGPDVVTRGFVYVKESEVLINETARLSVEVMDDCLANKITDVYAIKSKLSGAISNSLYQKTKRRPIILPIIMKV